MATAICTETKLPNEQMLSPDVIPWVTASELCFPLAMWKDVQYAASLEMLRTVCSFLNMRNIFRNDRVCI